MRRLFGTRYAVATPFDLGKLLKSSWKRQIIKLQNGTEQIKHPPANTPADHYQAEPSLIFDLLLWQMVGFLILQIYHESLFSAAEIPQA